MTDIENNDIRISQKELVAAAGWVGIPPHLAEKLVEVNKDGSIFLKPIDEGNKSFGWDGGNGVFELTDS